jgi:hypothetical protein
MISNYDKIKYFLEYLYTEFNLTFFPYKKVFIGHKDITYIMNNFALNYPYYKELEKDTRVIVSYYGTKEFNVVIKANSYQDIHNQIMKLVKNQNDKIIEERLPNFIDEIYMISENKSKSFLNIIINCIKNEEINFNDIVKIASEEVNIDKNEVIKFKVVYINNFVMNECDILKKDFDKNIGVVLNKLL